MFSFIKKGFITAFLIFWELKLSIKILVVLAAVGIFMFVSIELTGTPTFCNSCHIMNPYYDNWVESSHSSVSCITCHLEPGFANYLKGKINGLAQSVNCIVGRIGTKPNAKVHDSSCLRSQCHNTEKLASTKIDYNGIKFTHAKHIEK